MRAILAAMEPKLSVIIPVAKGETAWRSLIKDLAALSYEADIILVGSDEAPTSPLPPNVTWLHYEGTRAEALNAGAYHASHDWLWFLHADSRLRAEAITALEHALLRHPYALHYFNLAFPPDSPVVFRLNEWGAWLRSHLLGLPFGDQGFCIHRNGFLDSGGFPVDVEYGEDHLFAWQARHNGIPVICTGAQIITSHRKYQEHGWWPTTRAHQAMWWRQFIPEWRLWMDFKLGRH